MRRTPFEGVECGRRFRTIGLGYALQRLFSTFPDRWPGFGLLLLRLGLGITLTYLGFAGVFGRHPEPISRALNLIAAAAGVFLIAGLWTPVTAALAALDQVWIVLSLASAQRGSEWIHILWAVLSTSVAMLGPGAWSIDARLFGRRRLYRDRTRRQSF
jgi:uncharacterized membrane protein YphA (DoxX/SURF4 family)